MTTEIARAALSLEYVRVGVSANISLGAQDVNLAIIAADTAPLQADFDAATWELDPGLSNTARTSAPAAYPAASYDIYVQIEGSPEIPVLYAGRMLVT